MISHVDSFTHMQRFGCYMQHFVSPMVEFRMSFIANHDVSIAQYDHIDSHADSITHRQVFWLLHAANCLSHARI